MSYFCTVRRWVAAAALVTSVAGLARADTLVLRDGRQLVGEVERVDGGFMIMTPTGPQKILKADVVEYREGNAPPTTPPATVPGAPVPGAPAPEVPVLSPDVPGAVPAVPVAVPELPLPEVPLLVPAEPLALESSRPVTWTI